MSASIKDLKLHPSWTVFLYLLGQDWIVVQDGLGGRISRRIRSFMSEVDLFISEKFSSSGLLQAQRK